MLPALHAKLFGFITFRFQLFVPFCFVFFFFISYKKNFLFAFLLYKEVKYKRWSSKKIKDFFKEYENFNHHKYFDGCARAIETSSKCHKTTF